MYFELNNLEVTRCLTFEINAQSSMDKKRLYRPRAWRCFIHDDAVRFINDVKFARRSSDFRFGLDRPEKELDRFINYNCLLVFRTKRVSDLKISEKVFIIKIDPSKSYFW